MNHLLIPLDKGLFAIVDASDYQTLSKFKWCATWNPTARRFYATRSRSRGEKRGTIFMHRQVISFANTVNQVDHINGNGLDNRKANLRECSASQNRCNRPKQRNNTSGFKGVFWDKRCKKWFAQIRIHGKQKYLGVHKSKEDAALAYNQAAEELHGEFACLNRVCT